MTVSDLQYADFRTGMTFRTMAAIMAEECRQQYEAVASTCPFEGAGC